MMKFQRLIVAGLCLWALQASSLLAETWPQFRGVMGDGISNEKNLPTRWSKDAGVDWATELPGRANSSPAVTARRIDLTTQEEDDSLWIISIDRKTGELTRKVKVGKGILAATGGKSQYAPRHNPATPSPIADEDNIWAFFGSGLLVCLDAKTGSVKWQRDMVKDYGPYDIRFGMASSPRLWGELLYVACMTKGPSYVVALNKATGEEVWRADRELPAAEDGLDAYSTPMLLKVGGATELLVSGADHITAYEPETGKQLWISAGLKIDSPFGRVIASPVGADGVVVATSGNPPGGGLGHVLAVRGGGQADVTASHRLWQHATSTPDSSTPVALGGKLYMISHIGVASCLDLATGNVYWRKRLEKGPYHASVVAGDGKVYFLSIEGACTVVEAGSEGKILATNELPGTFYATPAIGEGVIYLRAFDRLYAISGD